MLRIPLLRQGRPYHSLSTVPLADVRTGEPVAEVSQANAGLIARDLAGAAEARRELEALTIGRLIEICRRAAQAFLYDDLPVGDAAQSPADYLRQLAATTGIPEALGRKNAGKIHYMLSEMETVLAGLTRGLDLGVLEAGWGFEGDRCVSYRRETEALGAVLPSNSPGVHSLWIPAAVLKVPLALRPGSQEPWTPYRIAQAWIAAGGPPEAFSFYPSDYDGAAEILLRAGRSMLFGDASTVAPWRGDPRVQIHGPGWSKVIFGADLASEWREHLDLLAESVAANGGRSCINASGVWTPAHGRALAEGLAERLTSIEARPLDDPEAALAAFPSRQAAERLSAHIDAQLRIDGAEDLTAGLRDNGRVAAAGGCWFLLPTVIYCSDPDHPLARAEYLFPFVTVVEVPQDELLRRIGETLVATLLSDDPALRRLALAAHNVERLNLGPIATNRVAWDQPHEGNLFEHLFRQRALQGPGPRQPAADGLESPAGSG